MAYSSNKHLVSTADSIVMKRRIKTTDIAPIRRVLQKEQGNTCPLCERKFTRLTACLDHCHATGYLRGVLCNNCNGIEGKLGGLLKRIDVGGVGAKVVLQRWLEWQDRTNEKYIHPHAETAKERVLRQKKRRATLARKKK